MAEASPGKAGILVASLLAVALAAGGGFALHELASPAGAEALVATRAAAAQGAEAAIRSARESGILPWLALPTLGPLLLAVLLLGVAARRRAPGVEAGSPAVADASGTAAPERRAAPPRKPETAEPAIPGAAGLRLLAVLQEEARLIDFVREDLDAHSDAQVGAAVRGIHASLRKAVDERLTVGTILAGEEGSAVEVPAGFDPARIRVVGDLRGDPPWRGVLRHAGWKAGDVRLPTPTPGSDPTILAPAEVEVGQ